MHSSQIDVSYFAAGIVAHMASCCDGKKEEEEEDGVGEGESERGAGGSDEGGEQKEAPREKEGEAAAARSAKEGLMRDLVVIVSRWENPKDEMVAYRSFRPFLPLLSVRQEFAVQLWAIWAIHQVCSKNRELSTFQTSGVFP